MLDFSSLFLYDFMWKSLILSYNLLFESGVKSEAAFGTFFAPRCMHWLDSLKVVLIYGLLPNQVVAHNNALTKKKCLKITVPLNEYEW